jgi:hypothetical protein
MKIVYVVESTASSHTNATPKLDSPRHVQILQWGEVSETLFSTHVDGLSARGIEKPDGQATMWKVLVVSDLSTTRNFPLYLYTGYDLRSH